MAEKNLYIGLWWSIMHTDAKEYCGTCDVFQRVGRMSMQDVMPLKYQLTM